MKKRFKLIRKIDNREFFEGTEKQCQDYEKKIKSSWEVFYIKKSTK